MASEGGSNSGIVAIFAIMLLVMVGAFIAWQAGVFGGDGDKDRDIDVKIEAPAK